MGGVFEWVWFLVKAFLLAVIVPISLVCISIAIGIWITACTALGMFTLAFVWVWYKGKIQDQHNVNPYEGSKPLTKKEVQQILEEYLEISIRSRERQTKATDTQQKKES